ncbi:MAG: YraN family protein [Candidatus Sumerlaeaceae bacterium]
MSRRLLNALMHVAPGALAGKVRRAKRNADVTRVEANRKTLNRIIGDLGENAAVRHLQRSGYRILERNHRCPAGEIDIIAEDRGTLAFVEVKTRSPRALLPPVDAVDDDKQGRIRSSAAHFLGAYRHASPHRYDIVCVYLDGQDKVLKIELMREAFV